MSSGQSSVDAATIERTKQQIRGIVQEIAQLSRENLSPDEYYAEVMHRVVTALAAIGGAVWTITPEHGLKLEYQINLSRHLVDPEANDSRRHLRLLQQVMQGGEAKLIPPLSGSPEADGPGNPTNSLLVLAPLQSDQAVEGVLEIFQRPDAQPGSQQGFLRFLVQMADYMGDWLRSRKLRHYSDRQSLWNQIDRFAKEVHNSLDLRETAYTIANEARRLIGCDRVTVAIARSGKQRIEAVSGQDTMDMRSNVITQLNRLVNSVCAAGEPLWHTGSSQDLPPQIEEALQIYVDESHTKSVAVIPLRQPLGLAPGADDLGSDEAPGADELKGEVIGALVVEWVDSVGNRELAIPRVDLVAQHSARAVNNSLQHHNLFLMPVWKKLGEARWLVQARTLPKTITVAALLLVAAIVLTVWPADFEMEAKGMLEPRVRQKVYFNVEGKVRDVLVDDGQKIEAGAPVIQLENYDLERQIQENLTKLSTSVANLNGLRQSLLFDRSNRNMTPIQRVQTEAQQQELEAQIQGLRSELIKLQAKREDLTVYAPVGGTVVAWEAEHKLLGRPVAPGQEALEIIDPSRDWELEIFMPEDKYGHVARARSSIEPDLAVRYVFEMQPSKELEGRLRSVQQAANPHEEHGVSVRMLIDIDRQDIPLLKKDAEVIAHVYCGRRALGYVWFHTLWEWAQKHVFF
jgi:biotin carboxyl carrier protein